MAPQLLPQEAVITLQPELQVLAQPPQAGACSQQGAGAGAQHGAGSQQLFCLWQCVFTGLQHLFRRPASAELVSSMAANAKIIPRRRMISFLQSNYCRPEIRPTSPRKLPKNAFRPREALQTPEQRMFRDRNLSNNPPIFSTMGSTFRSARTGPADGGRLRRQPDQIIRNSLDFALSIDTGQDRIGFCKQFVIPQKSVMVLQLGRGDSRDRRLERQQVVIPGWPSIPDFDSCHDKVQPQFFHPSIVATLSPK